MAPTIDKGAGGSKSVKVNRMTVWRINVKGEPPPVFTWWKDGKKIETNEDFLVEFQEYQGGSTAILQILKTQVTLFFLLLLFFPQPITPDARCWTIHFERRKPERE